MVFSSVQNQHDSHVCQILNFEGSVTHALSSNRWNLTCKTAMAVVLFIGRLSLDWCKMAFWAARKCTFDGMWKFGAFSLTPLHRWVVHLAGYSELTCMVFSFTLKCASCYPCWARNNKFNEFGISGGSSAYPFTSQGDIWYGTVNLWFVLPY